MDSLELDDLNPNELNEDVDAEVTYEDAMDVDAPKEKKKKKKKKKEKKEPEPVVYSIDCMFEVRKKSTDSNPFAKGFFPISFPETITHGELLLLLKRRYLPGLKPVKTLVFFDLEVIVKKADREYHVTNEVAWQELLQRIIAHSEEYQMLVKLHGARLNVGSRASGSSSKPPSRKRAKTGHRQTTQAKLALQEATLKNYPFVRTPEQQLKLDNMTKESEEMFGARVIVIDETHVECTLCNGTITLNRLYYLRHVQQHHFDNGRCERRRTAGKRKSSSGQLKITDMFLKRMLESSSESSEHSDAALDTSTSESEFDDSTDDVIDVDPCVEMLHNEITNGSLSKEHIFYKYINNALRFAQTIDKPSAQFSWDPTVRGFATSLRRLGGTRTVNCLRGPGFLHQKFGGKYNFNWSNWNFPFPPPVDDTGYTTSSGIIRPFLLGALAVCFDDRHLVEALLDTEMVSLIPLVTKKDGMAIKPGFQLDRRTKQIIGGQAPISEHDIDQMRQKKPEELKSQFITEAETWCVSTLDNITHFTLGTDFTVKCVAGTEVFHNDTRCISAVETCQHCLQESTDIIVESTTCIISACEECITKKSVCTDCDQNGYQSWSPKYRPCDRCVGKKVKCFRGVVMAHAMDCESKNLSAMKEMGKSTEIHPIPDPPHRAKNFDQSAANWFLFIDGCRFNRSLLRTLRNRETSISKALKETVSDRALRRRDRQDTSYVYESTSDTVRTILTKVKYVTQTIIPEPFRKSDVNKPGVLLHPVSIAVCNGVMFISDFGKMEVVRGRMHYPVDVESISGSFQDPRGIATIGGVIFLCEKSGIYYKDVDRTVVIQPKKMRKQELIDALTQRNLPTEGKRVRELQEDLSLWLTDNSPLRVDGKPGWYFLNIDTPSPLAPFAITGISFDNCWNIYASCPDDGVLYHLTVTSDGASLSAQVKCTSNIPGVTGLALEGNELFLAVSDTEDKSKGGIYVLNLETKVHKHVISSSSAYDVTFTGSNVIVFTEPENRKVRGFSYDREKGECVAQFDIGDTSERDNLESKDGCDTTTKFVQPSGLTSEGDTLFVCDTGIGAVKLITPIAPYVTYLKMINSLMKIFGVHYAFPPSLSDAIEQLRVVVDYFTRAVMATAEKLNRGPEGMQGPQGVPSYTAVSSLQHLLTSLENLKHDIATVNPNYNGTHVKSLTTLLNEHLHSCMRERYPMPTQLEFAHALSPVVEEAAKRVINTGYKYFTGRKSYYDVPSTGINITDFPKMPQPSSVKMQQTGIKKMRQFVQDFGDPVRQMTVRSFSTQDRPGTLPISAYGDCPVSVNLLDVAKLFDREHQVLVEKNEVIAIGRPGYANLPINDAIQGPFVLCRARADIDVTSEERIDVFVQDQSDPLHFFFQDTCIVDLKNYTIVQNLEVVYHRHHIDINEEMYVKCVHAVEQGTEDRALEEEEEEPEEVLLQLQTTRRGRAVKLPSRYKD